jgi:hypothetical protein
MKVLVCCGAAGALLVFATPAFAGAWSAPVAIDTHALTGVSCAPKGLGVVCEAVDDSGALTESAGGPWSAPHVIDAGHALTGISCAAASGGTLCGFIDDAGNAVASTNGSATFVHIETDPNATLQAISCAPIGPPTCIAVDSDGNAFRWTSTSGWSSSLFNEDGDVYEGVSCAFTGLCLGVTDTGYRTYAGSWSAKGTINGSGSHGISCVASDYCVTTDNSGRAAIFHGSGTWTPWQGIDGSSPFPSLASVLCPSASFCVAVDQAGNALLFNGSSWAPPANINGGNALSAVSCASISYCVAVGANGNAITYAADPGAQQWQARTSSASDDSANAEVYGPQGSRLYVTGTVGGGMDTIAYNDATGGALWARNYNYGANVGKAIGVSPNGSRVFVTGVGTLSGAHSDFVTIAYDAATGNRLWLQRYDSQSHLDDAPAALGVSPDGSKVFVTGASAGASSANDYATVAYDAASGARLWIARYNEWNLADAATAIGVSPDGSKVFVTGSSSSPGHGSDYATLAYSSSSGARLWATRFNGPLSSSDDQATSLGVSPDGTIVYVTGKSESSASVYAAATNAYNASAGAQLWSQRFSGGVVGNPELTVSPDGTRLFVAATVVLGNGGTTSDGCGHVIYKSSGGSVGSGFYDVAGVDDICNAIAASGDGTRFFIAGTSGSGSTGKDALTLAYDAFSSHLLWSRTQDGPAHGDDAADAVVVRPDSSKVAVAGSSTGSGTGLDWWATAYASG